MPTPLEIWKKAKQDFTVAVKNNKNTRKPGSWFTTGTESAIKAVMAIDYHADEKLSPQTWLKPARELDEKLSEKYEQEKEKLHKDKVKVLSTMLRVLQKKQKDTQTIEKEIKEESDHIEDLIGRKLALLEKENALLVRKLWKDKEQQYQKYITDKNQKFDTQMEKWEKNASAFERVLTAAKRSTDYDENYKKAIKILEEGLEETAKALHAWQSYVPEPMPRN